MYALRMCCLVLLTLFVGSGNALAKKPKNNDVVVSGITLDVLRVEACIDDTDECVIAGGPKQIELFDLADGNVEFSKKVLLPENTTELRLVLGNNNTITVDDKTFPLTVPSGQTSGLKLKGEGAFAETGGFLTSIILELNLNKALIVRGKKSVSYALKPVLQVANAELEPLPENTAGAVVLPDYESFMKLGDVFFLSIPADAVAEETILTVEEIKNYIEVLDPLTQQVIVQPDLASTFKLKPEGLVFATPLQLTLQYNIAALRDKFTEQDLTIRHDGHKVETTLDTYEQVVSGEISHFSSVTISTYSGKCTESTVGNFSKTIKYFDCDEANGYPRMHVAVADRSALAYTHQLKIFAHDSGEKDGRFTTEQVKSRAWF